MERVSNASMFRTLEPWEIELVSGGDYDGEDIVVYGGDGGGGDGGDGGWGGDPYGGYDPSGGYDPNGGDTGGGQGATSGGDSGTQQVGHTTVQDDHGQSITVDTYHNNTTNQSTFNLQVANPGGSFTTNWDVNHFDLKSFSLNIFSGSTTYTGSVNVDSGTATGTYTVNFSDGSSGSISVGTNGSDYSINFSFHAKF